MTKRTITKRIILALGIMAWSASAWAQPRVSLPNSPWDFGEVLQQEKVSHQFEVVNDGRDTLFISRVKPSCGCTTAPLTRDVVAPGESIWIDVTFNSKKFSGAVNKTVTVFSNDPGSPQAKITFLANVATARSKIVVVQEPTDLGSLVPNKSGQSTIMLANVGDEPYRLRLAAYPSGWLEPGWTEKVVDPGDTLHLPIGTNGVPPLGKFESSITFEIEGRETSRMSLPLTGIGLIE